MIWADIPGESGYQLSDSGFARSLDRTIEGRRGTVKGRVLSIWLHHGRRVTKLSGRRVYVDDLIAATFGTNPQRGMTCSKGHSLVSAGTWGARNRVCADCAAGVPRRLELPDLL